MSETSNLLEPLEDEAPGNAVPIRLWLIFKPVLGICALALVCSFGLENLSLCGASWLRAGCITGLGWPEKDHGVPLSVARGTLLFWTIGSLRLLGATLEAIGFEKFDACGATRTLGVASACVCKNDSNLAFEFESRTESGLESGSVSELHSNSGQSTDWQR